MRKSISSLLAIAACLTFLVGHAIARPFCVSTSEELQIALNTAATNGEDDVIRIHRGIYKGNFVYESNESFGIQIIGGYIDCINRISYPPETQLIGSGSEAVPDTVLKVYIQGSGDILIEGLMIWNGLSRGDAGVGGGIMAVSKIISGTEAAGNIIIRNNIIRENKAVREGGGIFAESYSAAGAAGDVTIHDNTIAGNTSSTRNGGGVVVYSRSDTGVSGKIILSGNHVHHNTSDWISSSGGGVIGFTTTGDFIVTENTFSHNLSGRGGGLYVDNDHDGNITITNNTFENNSSGDYKGGGAWVYNKFGTTVVSNNTFTNNSGSSGGGVWIKTDVGSTELMNNRFQSNRSRKSIDEFTFGGGASIEGHEGPVTVSNNTFLDNSATYQGGGLYTRKSGGGTLTLSNNIFETNLAPKRGGGFYIHGSDMRIFNNLVTLNEASAGAGAYAILGSYDTNPGRGTFTNNTVYENHIIGNAQRGRGLVVYIRKKDAILDIFNNIIWTNAGTEGGDIYINDNRGAFVNLHFNNFNGLQMMFGTLLSQGNNLNQDPILNSDLKLVRGSPCIDQGTNSAPFLPSTDFEGDPRPMGIGYDIGADEFNTDTDGDGIPDDEESGDNNNDGIPDSEQSNVASFHTFIGSHPVTLVTPYWTDLTNVQAVDIPDNPPAGVDLPYGLFRFKITNVGPFGVASAVITLPEGESPDTYVKCDSDNVCYEFLYDGETGAEISGNVITLHFIDGGRGDQDGVVNNVIVDPGAPGIVENQPPVAVCRDVTLSTEPGTCSAMASVDAGSHDPDGDPISITLNPAGPYPLGETTVTLTVTDSKGASVSCTARVLVLDEEAPVPELLPMITGECSVEISSMPTASDNCSGVITGSTTDPLVYTEQGSYTINWTFDDGNGNIATRPQTVKVQDITSPVLVDPPDMIVEATGPSGQTIEIGTAVVTDNCDPAPSVSHNAPALFPIGTTPVTWTAVDAAGNTAMAIQNITVQDTTAPTITLTSPKHGEIYPNTLGKINIDYTAEDVADENLDISMTLDGKAFTGDAVNPCEMTLGSHTLVITVTDDAGNAGTASATFMIESQAFQSFSIRHMMIRWARDKDKWPWYKRFWLKKKDRFRVSGQLTLPEGYDVSRLSKSATVSISITGHTGNDTVKFKGRSSRKWRIVWRYRGSEQPPGQGMNIHRMSIRWWQRGNAVTGSFNIKGILQLPDDIGVETLPPEAGITLEIPVDSQTGCGSIRGEDGVKFRVYKRINLWNYYKKH